MFVRWQKSKRKARAIGRGRSNTDADTHWAAILVESTRVDGKPTQRHIAYLGGITDSGVELETPSQRAFFWQGAMQQLNQLANRVTDDRARIEEALEQKVPRLTRKEYDAWIVYRTERGFEDYGKAPSFKVCGVPETKERG